MKDTDFIRLIERTLPTKPNNRQLGLAMDDFELILSQYTNSPLARTSMVERLRRNSAYFKIIRAFPEYNPGELLNEHLGRNKECQQNPATTEG